MEEIFNYLCQNAPHAHYLFFGLLMLAGLNIPISEDLLLLMSGVIAALCLNDHFVSLYLWMFAGCFLSGMEAYWIGRILGPRLYRLPFFKKFITEERVANLHTYYERFGVFTFIIGRFIPCGFRNALFMSAGMGKMPFLTFISRDFFAALLSSVVLYSIGFQSAAHYQELFTFFQSYSKLFFLTLFISITLFLLIRNRKKEKLA